MKEEIKMKIIEDAGKISGHIISLITTIEELEAENRFLKDMIKTIEESK